MQFVYVYNPLCNIIWFLWCIFSSNKLFFNPYVTTEYRCSGTDQGTTLLSARWYCGSSLRSGLVNAVCRLWSCVPCHVVYTVCTIPTLGGYFCGMYTSCAGVGRRNVVPLYLCLSKATPFVLFHSVAPTQLLHE